MTDASWSRYDGEDCIRLEGAAPGADVEVRPATATVVGRMPAMAGRWIGDGEARCFVPRFAFVDGTTYTVTIAGIDDPTTLVRPRRDCPATTEVAAIHPTTTVVPRNLLRLYVSFSAPMSEGYAARHVRLVDQAGQTMVASLLAHDHELWDPARRRLTVLLDPARIKRGLVPHRQAGYPLRLGMSIRVVIDAGFRDASGTPLRAGAERSYRVGDDQRHRVDPNRWTMSIPPAGSLEPLAIGFDRPLDHGLLGHCLHVFGPHGRGLHGRARVGPQERSWRFIPTEPWPHQTHHLEVDPILEDLAGNSVTRVFDRDLTDTDDQPTPARPAVLAFCPL